MVLLVLAIYILAFCICLCFFMKFFSTAMCFNASYRKEKIMQRKEIILAWKTYLKTNAAVHDIAYMLTKS